jgi:hypothetical protein
MVYLFMGVSAAICEKYGRASNMEELRVNIMDAYSDFLFFVPAVQSLQSRDRKNESDSESVSCRSFSGSFFKRSLSMTGAK